MTPRLSARQTVDKEMGVNGQGGLRWDRSMKHQLYEFRMGLYWMRLAMDMNHEEPNSEVLHWARYILVEQERTDTRPDDAPVLGLYD